MGTFDVTAWPGGRVRCTCCKSTKSWYKLDHDIYFLPGFEHNCPAQASPPPQPSTPPPPSPPGATLCSLSGRRLSHEPVNGPDFLVSNQINRACARGTEYNLGDFPTIAACAAEATKNADICVAGTIWAQAHVNWDGDYWCFCCREAFGTCLVKIQDLGPIWGKES